MLFKVHYDLDPATKTNHDDRASQDAMILNGGGRQMKCWQIGRANKQDMTCGISWCFSCELMNEWMSKWTREWVWIKLARILLLRKISSLRIFAT